jgi:hypothetical protein
VIKPDENSVWEYKPAYMQGGLPMMPGQEHCTVVQEDGSKLEFRRYPKIEHVKLKPNAPIAIMMLSRRDIEHYGLQRYLEDGESV